MTPLPLAELQKGIPLTFRWPVKACTYSTIGVYVVSILTSNVSQVDRLWTFLPVMYTAYFALLPYWPTEGNAPFPMYPTVPEGMPRDLVDMPNPRTMVMLVLQVLWGLRLNYNAWRRGILNPKDEDYRWAVLRTKIPPWFFQVTNIVFIAIIQNILLFLIAVPTHTAAILPPSARSLTTSDYVLTALSLITIYVEFVSDNQQYAYQTFKRTGVKDPHADWPGSRIDWTADEVQRGFVTRGFWAWSRHPNCLCEQLFWILQNFYPILAVAPLKDVVSRSSIIPLIPSLSYCLLFYCSTLFTESISASKYPEAYAAYQKRVPMFVPFLTPVYGWVLNLTGQREYCDRMVWGAGPKKGETAKSKKHQ